MLVRSTCYYVDSGACKIHCFWVIFIDWGPHIRQFLRLFLGFTHEKSVNEAKSGGIPDNLHMDCLDNCNILKAAVVGGPSLSDL